MKKAILDDITPVKQALSEKKRLVAAGLGKKLSEADLRPLVEETQLNCISHVHVRSYA